jgi:hypothetical protein
MPTRPWSSRSGVPPLQDRALDDAPREYPGDASCAERAGVGRRIDWRGCRDPRRRGRGEPGDGGARGMSAGLGRTPVLRRLRAGLAAPMPRFDGAFLSRAARPRTRRISRRARRDKPGHALKGVVSYPSGSAFVDGIGGRGTTPRRCLIPPPEDRPGRPLGNTHLKENTS